MNADTLTGKNLYLEPLKEKTYSFLVIWLSDRNIIKFLDDSECHLTLEQIKEMYPVYGKTKTSILFSIIEKNSHKTIGICGLQKIDINKKNAFLRIIIGDTNFWNGKTALETEKLILKFAFSELKLNRIYSIINVKNIGQIMLVERLGMKKDGISRNYFVQNGEYVDAGLYSMLSNEFKDF